MFNESHVPNDSSIVIGSGSERFRPYHHEVEHVIRCSHSLPKSRLNMELYK